MSTCNRLAAFPALFPAAVLACLAALASPLAAQETPLDPLSSIKIDLPANAPLSLISTAMGDSRATSRGGAIVLDLHMGLTLRNAGDRKSTRLNSSHYALSRMPSSA